MSQYLNNLIFVDFWIDLIPRHPAPRMQRIYMIMLVNTLKMKRERANSKKQLFIGNCFLNYQFDYYNLDMTAKKKLDSLKRFEKYHSKTPLK